MRAELFPRTATAMQAAILLLLASIISGCKTEKDPDQPTILGIPPATAYLGVEYYYNFGAYGGESILDYTLTNAPSWLALEDTSNKARQGIIMRGVPGLSGGNRGDADLGKLTGINLVSTDGRMAGAQPFDIEVKYNALSLEADTFTEGSSPTIPDTRREHCALPDLKTPGEHTFTVNTYDENGDFDTTEQLTLPTRAVFAKVLLNRPSVTRVAVAFELLSNYDATNCDPGFSGSHQRCDHSKANVGEAIPGQDIVALGSNSDALLEELSYLEYEKDSDGFYTGGVVTLEPGITECYIRLEVVDDSFPEPSEAAQLQLTEVRSGLAGLGETNGGVLATLVIADNEPQVILETKAGGARDALNVGGSRTYVARLKGDRDGEVYAKLTHTENSTARLGEEFETNLTDDLLVFTDDQEEVEFTVNIAGPTPYANPGPHDRVILLGLDTAYQRGRENFARAAGEDMLRININELVSPLSTGSENDFVATDMAVGHNGKMFIAGYNSQENHRVQVKIFDQKGALLQQFNVSEAGGQLSQPEPVINLAKREVTENNVKSDRYELVVAYNTDELVPDTGEDGLNVATSLYWYNETINDGEYVEVWTMLTGTSGDDKVRWAGINAANGSVIIAGETDGVWPGQTSAGGVDSFLQRIDSLPDGNGFVPAVAWTRQVGSSADDHVAGASVESVNQIVFGSAAGAVNNEPVVGGEDVYFYTTASADGNLTVNQSGTEADEQVTDGVLQGITLWLLGNSTSKYSVTPDDEGNLSLTGDSGNSASGFVLGYTTSGDLMRAFNLNDENDTSKEQFAALTGFSGDLVAAGHTDGDFTGEASTSNSAAILARLSLEPEPDEENSVFRNEWRYQLNANDSEVIRLANYRDDEIVALVRKGAESQILLFSPEGVLLTP